MVFIESTSFTKAIYNYLNDEEYKDFQTKIAEYPSLGNIIPGCGGIRKVRWAQKSKLHGKRSGLRIYYLYLEQLNHTHLLAILEKGEKEDLSSKEKAILKDLAIKLKSSAKSRRI